METRASHILIGGFVLVSMIALFGFVIWLARVEIAGTTTVYDIYFEGSVAGLGVGGDVRYHGIKIGAVQEINVDAEDPTRVKVQVEVDQATPIREGDMARLQLQGITGLSFINIDGASKGAEPIQAPDDGVPVIPSQPSEFEKLFAGAPQLLDQANLLLVHANELLSEDNRRNLSGIIADIRTLTSSLAGRSDQVEALVDTWVETSKDVKRASHDVQVLVTKSQGLVDEATTVLAVARSSLMEFDDVVAVDVRGLLGDLRKTAKSANELVEGANAIFTDNREELSVFASDGLGDIQHLVTETRLLIASLLRVSERLESDGARFLLGERESEFKAE
jgi:phospholipid/cholesterol/gamma-HCH transport system substrate-binding protein